MQKERSMENGKMGGRPKCSKENFYKIPNTKFVILTFSQYEKLLNKYGKIVFEKAIELLENWLSSSPSAQKYRGKNNYGHFRSDGWVINSALNIITPPKV